MVDRTIPVRDSVRGTSQESIDGIIQTLQKQDALKDVDAYALKQDFEKSDIGYFEDFLLEEGLVDGESLLQALESYYQVKSIDVLGEIFDRDLLVKFPKDVLLRSCCLPYRKDGNLLFVIAADPREDLEVLLREFVSYDVEFLVGIPHHIDMMIKDFYDEPLYKLDYEDTVEEAGHEVEEERERDEHERYEIEDEFGD